MLAKILNHAMRRCVRARAPPASSAALCVFRRSPWVCLSVFVTVGPIRFVEKINQNTISANLL